MKSCALTPVEEQIAAALARALVREVRQEGFNEPRSTHTAARAAGLARSERSLEENREKRNGVLTRAGKVDQDAICVVDVDARVTAIDVTDRRPTPC